MTRRPVDLDRVRRATETIRATLREHPEVAARTAAMFHADPSSPELHAMSETQTTPIKLPIALLERVDALLPRVEADPRLSALVGRRSRTALVRLAILRGLEILERELPPAP